MDKSVFVFILFVGLTPFAVRSQEESGSGSTMDECLQKIDLIIVLDGSFSVTSENFELVKRWVKELVGDMHISHGHTQIGVVQYSFYDGNRPMNRQRYIKTEIELGEHMNRIAFNDAVDRIEYQGYQTYTAHALNKTLNEDFVGKRNRYPEAKRALILLTDGKATDYMDLPPVIARATGEMGVVIYAVGVGQFDESELLLITGHNSARVFKQESFDDLHKIVSALQIQLTQSCDCNPDGSVNLECDACTKQCFCKPNVAGRRCDRCVSDHFGLGRRGGCLACNCNVHGSTNTTCDATTGQCHCKQWFRGRTCGRCQKGCFGFPNCRPCHCNGFSQTCDRDTGACIGCSGGRRGNNCEICPVGHFLNRTAGNGQCQPCSCNNNTDSCDPLTGVCIKCSHNTAGKHCEKCKPFYYRNVETQLCERCHCHTAGTNHSTCVGSKCTCDGTGQCSCLGNVEGRTCNKCARNTWQMKKGRGCIKCQCNGIGCRSSISCHKVSGQCSCKVGYTGRTCSRCSPSFTHPSNSRKCVPENLIQTSTTPSTTRKTTTTTRRTPIRVNPGWSPCVSCGRQTHWRSYCRGWLCRRRWPYHQQYPSTRRCYSWNWSCRSSMQYNYNPYQQNFDSNRGYYPSGNRPNYYRGYNHHPRQYRRPYYRAPVRYNLYKNN